MHKPTLTKIGEHFVLPTTRGDIRWRPMPWGVLAEEHIYFGYDDTVVQHMKLPWVALQAMLNGRPSDV